MKFELHQHSEHPYHRGIGIGDITDITDNHVFVRPYDDPHARVRIPKRRLIFWSGVWRYV